MLKKKDKIQRNNKQHRSKLENIENRFTGYGVTFYDLHSIQKFALSLMVLVFLIQ